MCLASLVSVFLLIRQVKLEKHGESSKMGSMIAKQSGRPRWALRE